MRVAVTPASDASPSKIASGECHLAACPSRARECHGRRHHSLAMQQVSDRGTDVADPRTSTALTFLPPFRRKSSSNNVTLSAFVQTPTRPEPAMLVVNLDVGLAVERNSDALPEKSTRSACHSFFATGASTYLMVIRRPLCV